MRRFLLISLSLVLALAGWSTVGAEDGFYVIPAMKGKYAPVPKTGQTASTLSKDDGDLEKGEAWPTPRFTANGNGTVTDNLTKLIWLQNAYSFVSGRSWANALIEANILQSGSIPGLTDNSKAGDWRLPNVRELKSLLDYGGFTPAILPAGHPFTNVMPGTYWSSTAWAHPTIPTNAWIVRFTDGTMYALSKSTLNHVWCVRGGP
jgi:hypothetical protein